MSPDLEEKLLEKLTQHEGYIRAIIANKCSAPEVDRDEIFQEVCTNVWKHRDRFRVADGEVKTSHFKKWVASFTHNQVVWYFSKKKRKDRKIDFDSEKFDAVSAQIGENDGRLDEKCTKESVSHLYYKYRAVLTPHEQNVFRLMWRGIKIEEIGNIFGLTHQRISQIAEDIRNKIKKRFKSSMDEVIDENTFKLPKHLAIVTDFFNSSRDGRTDHNVYKDSI